jgi:hypothetical protein
MKRGTPNHPKMFDLASSLKVALPHAVGIMEMLWHFAATYAPNGSLTRFTPSQIAQAVGWESDPKVLTDALMNGWVDGDMFIHDWPEHCETAVHMKLARSGEHFACGCTPNQSRLPTSDRKGNRIVCARHRSEACAQKQDVRTKKHGKVCAQKVEVCAQNKGVRTAVAFAVASAQANVFNDVGANAPVRKEKTTTTATETTQSRVRTQKAAPATDPTRNDSQPRHMDWVVHNYLVHDRRMREEDVVACEQLVRGFVPWSAHTLGSVSDAIDARKEGVAMKNVWSYASGISVGAGPSEDTRQKASHWIKSLERMALELEAALASDALPPRRLVQVVNHWRTTHPPVKAKAVGQVETSPFD